MSQQFYDYYNFIKKGFDILKSNKTKTIFRIKQHYYIFNVDLKNIKCDWCKDLPLCNLKKCYHIYHLYEKIYKISPFDLEFLWKNDNYLKVIVGEDILFDEKDTECMICLEDTFPDYTKLYCCLNCGTYYHIKCLRKMKKSKCLNCCNDF